jgi:hypothetical protein
MNDQLKFIVDHKVISWIFLVAGLLSLLQVTFFYRASVRLTQRVLDSRWIQAQRGTSRFNEIAIPWYGKLVENRWVRVVGCILSLTFITLGIAGLVLL